jgi:outer membrane protein insertion porin family/translocation and assembly module TamA
MWIAFVAVGCAHLPEGRYAIDDVEIQGQKELRASDIEDKIATAASPRFMGLPQGVVVDYELFDRYVLDRDLTRVERIYRAHGFYEAHARAGRVEKTSDGHVKVTIVVDEGPVVSVGDVKLEGITSLSIDDSVELLKAVRHKKLREKQPFDEDNYDQAREALVEALADRGYAFAQVKGAVEIDLLKHLAHVIFTVNAGQQARIGAVSLSGLGDIPDGPVRRAVDLEPGEIYSASKLVSARQAVLALGVFADAEVTPDLSHPESPVVPVNVRVVPTELRSVRLGGGLELTPIKTDWHILTGWQDRNFLGGLRRLTIDMRPGVVLYPTNLTRFQLWDRYLAEGRASAELRQPGFIEARTGGTIRGGLNLYPVLFDQALVSNPNDPVLGYRDITSGVGLDRPFGPLYTSLFYNFQTSFPFGYGGDVQGFNKVVISYADLATNLDLRDDPVHPHKGLFIGNDFQVAGVPVTPNFRSAGDLFPVDLKVQPEVRAYIPLSRKSRNWTLALRATTGFLFPSNYASVSSFEQGTNVTAGDVQLLYFRGFFSGGPNSNRGYPLRGVGARDQLSFFLPGVTPGDLLNACMNPDTSFRQCSPDQLRDAIQTFCRDPQNKDAPACNFATGGLSLWEASVELRFPIISSAGFGGVVFCDASDVSRQRFHLRWLYPHLSCGGGLRYDTPIGPIRLDVGFQIPGLQVLDPASTEAPSPSIYAISLGILEAF